MFQENKELWYSGSLEANILTVPDWFSFFYWLHGGGASLREEPTSEPTFIVLEPRTLVLVGGGLNGEAQTLPFQEDSEMFQGVLCLGGGGVIL